jgi:hypothetical protein
VDFILFTRNFPLSQFSSGVLLAVSEDAVRNLKKIPESHYAVRFDRCRVENIEDVMSP